MITAETRREAHEQVDKEQRYSQIIDILKEGAMTAKEVAVEMCNLGYTPTSERNFSGPRLTELVKQGKVNVIGKKNCSYTNRTVGVYSLTSL